MASLKVWLFVILNFVFLGVVILSSLIAAGYLLLLFYSPGYFGEPNPVFKAWFDFVDYALKNNLLIYLLPIATFLMIFLAFYRTEILKLEYEPEKYQDPIFSKIFQLIKNFFNKLRKKEL